jgi:hypothetical protein
LGEAERITVHVKYGEIEQTFTGNVNDVWVSVNKFFGEVIPTFDIARKVTLTVDLARLIEDFKDVIAIAPEGPEVLISKERLTDSETLQLYLLAAYIGYRLGKLTRETMTKEELMAKLGKNMKITTTRLGELVKDGLTAKLEEGDYKITTIGIKRLQDEALPKIRAKFKEIFGIDPSMREVAKAISEGRREEILHESSE